MDERQQAGAGGAASATHHDGSGSHYEAGQQGQSYDVMEQAKQSVSEAAGEFGGILQQQVDKGYHKAGEMLDGWIGSLDTVADSLDRQGNHEVSNMIHGASERAHRVSDYVEHTSVDDVLADANDYAREHMWTVIAAGAALGLLFSRFLKASTSATSRSMGGHSQQSMSGYRSAGGGYQSSTGAYSGGSAGSASDYPRRSQPVVW